MNHADAIIALTDLPAGGPAAGSELARHVEKCPDCREWLAASGFLADALSASPAGAIDHLTSEDLVAYALEPASLTEGARESCKDHLGNCLACRRELGLVHSAVEEAREASPAEPLPADRRALPYRRFAASGDDRPRLRWAAAAVLVLAAGAWLVAGTALEAPTTQVVSGATLDGEQTVEARDSLVVHHTVVASGARVALGGGEEVILGNGFTVGSGAILAVSNRDRSDDDSS